MTPLERAARALCEIDDVDPDSSLGGDGQNFLWMEYANVHVRAVLQAIREPSAGMMGDRVVRQHAYAGDVDMVWQAMIDTALRETDASA